LFGDEKLAVQIKKYFDTFGKYNCKRRRVREKGREDIIRALEGGRKGCSGDHKLLMNYHPDFGVTERKCRSVHPSIASKAFIMPLLFHIFSIAFHSYCIPGHHLSSSLGLALSIPSASSCARESPLANWHYFIIVAPSARIESNQSPWERYYESRN
jgi:hypothetical protein